jgi:lysophospholipase L1-like esterase
MMAEIGVRARQYLRYGTFSTIGGSRWLDPATRLIIPEAGSSNRTIRINALGFRGPEIVQPKPPGTRRLAFVGASTTFCAEVSSNEQAWPHLVWNQMRARYPNVSFDYVNAGLPGAVTASSRVNFQQRVKPLAPDVVVLYEGFNDMIADSRRIAEQQQVRISSTEETGIARISVLWLLLKKNLTVIAARGAARSGQRRVVLPATIADRFADELRELIGEAKQVAPIVAVATLSSRLRPGQNLDEQLEAADAALYYMPYLTPSDIRGGYESYNAVIRSVAREKDAVLIEGENTIPPDALHFRDTIHLADAGSERMAERVVDALVHARNHQQLITSWRTDSTVQAAKVRVQTPTAPPTN